ncbi:MAG TPA: hypothetical protein VEC17_02935 [Candidatus Binatia bacterium]|nr:hypothetical protein [Candidatus Binatia bacterium]
MKKIKWVILAGVLILVAWGIYQNPDRRTDRTELEAIFTDSQQMRSDIQADVSQIQDCFTDNEIEVDLAITTKCLNGLTSVIVKVDNEKIIVYRLEEYHKSHKEDLDNETKKIVEDSIKLNNSAEYKAVLAATKSFYDAHIDYYTFLQNNLQDKTVDDLSESELLNLVAIGNRTESTWQEVQNKQTVFKNYVLQNYGQEFLDYLGFN